MTTRQIILLRHAHAVAPVSGQSDHDRPLSDVGEAEAEAAARFLAGLPRPERVLCSPAVRTRQTAERVCQHLGYVDTRYDPRIYEATPGQLIDVLDAHADAPHLLLVGHNPGLEHLVALLSTGRSGDFRGMPPAAIAVLSVPQGVLLEPGVAELAAFWSP